MSEHDKLLKIRTSTSSAQQKKNLLGRALNFKVKMNRSSLIASVFGTIMIVLLFFSCKKEELVQPLFTEVPQNKSVYTNQPNSFSYTIKARLYSMSEEFFVNMNSQSIEISATIESYDRGRVKIVIYTDKDWKVFEREFAGNAVFKENYTFDQLPKKIQFIYTDFTGSLSCVIKVK